MTIEHFRSYKVSYRTRTNIYLIIVFCKIAKIVLIIKLKLNIDFYSNFYDLSETI